MIALVSAVGALAVIGIVIAAFFSSSPRRREPVDLLYRLSVEERATGTEARIKFEQLNLVVKIPPGVVIGTRVRIAGQGHYGGHLFIEIRDVSESPPQ